jgi:predicted CopG family antitoxin
MRTTLTIPDDIYAQIVSIAKAADLRVSEVVTDALKRRLNPQTSPTAMASPEENEAFPFIPFPATGKSFTSEEVRRALEADPFD